MNIETGKKMIFISSWPHGSATVVEILGKNPNIENGWYIRKANGGSDTTTPDFLFEIDGGATHKTGDPKYGINAGKVVNMTSGEAIPADEPIFVFRAKDIHAVTALNAYFEECKNLAHQAAILQRVEDFINFRIENKDRMNEPDTEISH